MFLKKKIAGSSLAEVVIALAVIALCFGVASLIFTRSIMVTTGFEEVRTQTEIQSQLWEHMQNEESALEVEGTVMQTEVDERCDSLMDCLFLGVNDKVVWRQQILKNE